jgi:hypothetical protein
VVPFGSFGATGRKSAPSLVAAEESPPPPPPSSSEEHEVQQQDDEVQEREEEEEEEEAGAVARPKVYVRGHSTLPERPILPVNRLIMRSEGTR